jgi:hypothetical protein
MADKESTYTVAWTFTNTSNDTSSVVAKATLPNGVVWKGQISPTTEKISYDPDSRTITCNAELTFLFLKSGLSDMVDKIEGLHQFHAQLLCTIPPRDICFEMFLHDRKTIIFKRKAKLLSQGVYRKCC